MITNLLVALFVVVAICLGLATLREKRRAEKNRRRGDSAFRLHTHALNAQARR